VSIIVAGPTTGKTTLAKRHPDLFLDAEEFWRHKKRGAKGYREYKASILRDYGDLDGVTLLTSWWGRIPDEHPLPECFFFRNEEETVLESLNRTEMGDGVAFTLAQVREWHIPKQIEAARGLAPVIILGRGEYLADYLMRGEDE